MKIGTLRPLAESVSPRRTALWAGPALVFGVIATTAVSEPLVRGYAPHCLLHETTGLYCPGCGGTRAFFALIHGDLVQSLRYNPWTLVLMAGLTIWSGKRVIRMISPGHRLGIPLATPGWALWSLLGAVIAFGVLRNFPWWPFTVLAPPGP